MINHPSVLTAVKANNQPAEIELLHLALLITKSAIENSSSRQLTSAPYGRFDAVSYAGISNDAFFFA
jgi:hypothetical protein